MAVKRQLILSVILAVALALTVSIAYAVSCSHVETWNFDFSTYVSGWNSVETQSFRFETLSWNHADETVVIISCMGWLPILTPVLILIFASTILAAVIYTKKWRKQK